MHYNLSWDLQLCANDPTVPMSEASQVLRFGPEAGDASARVVGVEPEMQSDGVVNAA